ncbi:MAG: YceI family protein [Saprospiraceae bacterium]|nr:YceI family protein [Saprospiraceae bacterium]
MTLLPKILIVASFLFISDLAFSQQLWEVDPSLSKATVDGNSTLKKWSAETNSIRGKVQLDSMNHFISVQLFFESASLEGGRGADMDKKIYLALKADDFPEVSYQSNHIDMTGENGMIRSIGKVVIAGEEREISIDVHKGSDPLSFTAEKDLKLSEFSIEPPTAMFGQIVCYDDISLSFELSFKKINQ